MRSEENIFRPNPALQQIVGTCQTISRSPRDYEVSAHNLDVIEPVESGRELFASAVSVFPVVDPSKLLSSQMEEFGPYFEFLKLPETASVPPKQSKHSMRHFFLRGNILFRSYLPGHLGRRSDCRDLLIVPTSLRKLVVNSCHDLPASCGYLAFKGTFDKARDGFWWPTMHNEVSLHVGNCLSC